MNCKDCKYYKNITIMELGNITNVIPMCCITHIIKPKSCTYIADDTEVENMSICYNCKYWLGGGDWGLSCQKDYYNCSANGFDEACDKFERK